MPNARACTASLVTVFDFVARGVAGDFAARAAAVASAAVAVAVRRRSRLTPDGEVALAAACVRVVAGDPWRGDLKTVLSMPGEKLLRLAAGRNYAALARLRAGRTATFPVAQAKLKAASIEAHPGAAGGAP